MNTLVLFVPFHCWSLNTQNPKKKNDLTCGAPVQRLCSPLSVNTEVWLVREREVRIRPMNWCFWFRASIALNVYLMCRAATAFPAAHSGECCTRKNTERYSLFH